MIWLANRECRENLEGTFAITGIGVARGSTDEYFFSQIFLNEQLR
ncbi:hypothetical protein [Gloeobacter kilaueensis]|uniref:Uncharacterized protein n=1 Tax=Gloeobacter kilaueensis (strain ATCC BAA-2537 / CCAP 1431/1 / ULC 316 / JS1) TaxID=1183438 RepID=U5QG02_GLOK1|nr:hypothetical protein [Gloeobacter kilaueensis]AGY56569.1 hypothetical protein GKIL_0322 [Gloeobacter kilaueensis JS1]